LRLLNRLRMIVGTWRLDRRGPWLRDAHRLQRMGRRRLEAVLRLLDRLRTRGLTPALCSIEVLAGLRDGSDLRLLRPLLWLLRRHRVRKMLLAASGRLHGIADRRLAYVCGWSRHCAGVALRGAIRFVRWLTGKTRRLRRDAGIAWRQAARRSRHLVTALLRAIGHLRRVLQNPRLRLIHIVSRSGMSRLLGRPIAPLRDLRRTRDAAVA
jgi:hypothetical protein